MQKKSPKPQFFIDILISAFIYSEFYVTKDVFSHFSRKNTPNFKISIKSHHYIQKKNPAKWQGLWKVSSGGVGINLL